MRALAEFIMRGRTQATVVALIGSWFPLISPAAVALVTLRRGAYDGAIILLWALLPAVLTFFLGTGGHLMALITISGLIATFAVALLLRNSASWPQLLMGLVALSTLAALALGALVPDPVQDLTRSLGELLQQLPETKDQLTAPTAVFVIGLIAYAVAVNSLLSVLLARWWQALLYNPGGFRTEFQQLRLHPVAALVSMAATLYCFAGTGNYQFWGNVFALPLLVAGVALMHWVVAARKMGVQWLVLFYMALLLLNPLSVVSVAVIALLDSWLNFRERIRPKL